MDLARTAELLWGTVIHRPYVYAFFACFAVFAGHQLGWRRTLTFGVTAWLVAFGAEWSSTRNGFPFGPYRYFDVTRDRELWISNVPFWDSLSFVFLSYFSLALAGALLARPGEREPPAASPLLHPAAPLLGAALMTLLDVVIDPVTLQGDRWFLGRIYDYPYRGFWFGVTAANFAGWYAVGAATQWLFQREVAVLPWCRGAWRPVHPLFAWGLLGVYAGVFGFMLAMTVAIGDLPLAAASGAVVAATLVPVSLRLARRPRRARVVLCAASETEAAACRRGLAAARVRDVEVLRIGVGASRAAASLARRLGAGPPPALIVSAGFAGALGPGLEVGEAVTARAVFHLEPAPPRAVHLPAGALRPAPHARAVDVVSGSAVVAGGHPWPGPAVVDMESAALAKAAVAAGARFAVLRVVTDTPAAPLPAVAREAARAMAAGGLARLRAAAAIVREGVRDPAAAIALARASRAWTRALEAAVRASAAELVAAADAPEPRGRAVRG